MTTSSTYSFFYSTKTRKESFVHLNRKELLKALLKQFSIYQGLRVNYGDKCLEVD